MAKNYDTKLFNPAKQGNITRYRNQGYSGEDLYNIKQREESYDKWVTKGSPVAEKERKAQQSPQIGRVSSSWLETLGYNMDTGEAVATFKEVNAEFFYKMSYDTFLSWLNSPSKGKWLHQSGIMHNYTVRGGTGDRGFQRRLKGLYKKDNGKRMGSDGTTLAKARVTKYLAKFR